MSFKLHLILAVSMQIRCNFSDISYLSETQKNNFQFLNEGFFSTVRYFNEMRKKCVISVNSYYLKNHIYFISDIVIAIILNVAAEVFVHFWHRNK